MSAASTLSVLWPAGLVSLSISAAGAAWASAGDHVLPGPVPAPLLMACLLGGGTGLVWGLAFAVAGWRRGDRAKLSWTGGAFMAGGVVAARAPTGLEPWLAPAGAVLALLGGLMVIVAARMFSRSPARPAGPDPGRA